MARTLEAGRRPVELMERDAATPWTDERLEELRRLWVEETLSSSEIAERMGISRGTVMGKINRLGLLATAVDYLVLCSKSRPRLLQHPLAPT